MKHNIKLDDKKAQVGILDMLASVFIFLILMTVVMIYWYDYNRTLLDRLEKENSMTIALAVTDNLIKNPGKPTDWNSSNVLVIGLASSDHELSEEKVQGFCNMSYNQTRALLNIMHQFYFSVLTYESGSWSKKEAECGLMPSENSTIINVARPVVYKNQLALMKFLLWR